MQVAAQILVDDEHTCSACRRTMPYSAFSKTQTNSKRRPQCKACVAARPFRERDQLVRAHEAAVASCRPLRYVPVCWRPTAKVVAALDKRINRLEKQAGREANQGMRSGFL
jgi:hypothetical protein